MAELLAHHADAPDRLPEHAFSQDHPEPSGDHRA